MMNQSLVGAWTYRSFLNIPEPVDDFNKLRFGQGEMVIEAFSEADTLRGQLAFRDNPPNKDDPRLLLRGSLQPGNPACLRFQGTGVAGTSAAGWVYDYLGYLVPAWPSGKDQKVALVGTVTRTAPHDGRPAGVVGSFIAVHHEFAEPRTVIPLPDSVRAVLASKHHRLHHTVWHGARGMWNDNLSEEEKNQIRELAWQPGGTDDERPAIKAGAPLVSNGSGEDFLFMHRRMIQEVNAMMAEAGLEPIGGWPTIPAPGPVSREPNYDVSPPVLPTPGNPDGFAVPPTWFDPADEVTNRRITLLKTDGHYWSRMRWWDRQFKDSQYLSTVTLGELGALIEFSVHNDMHMRWASVPRHPETGEMLPSGRADGDTRDFWDNPNYDFLGEFYSSHVNPLFWRLHGWVDDRIDDWFRAHEAAHPGEVVRAEVEGVPWFKKGRWIHTDSPWAGPLRHGGNEHHHEHDEHGNGHDDEIEIMKRVVEILFGPAPADQTAKAFKAEALTELQKDQRRATRFTWF